MTTRRRDTHRLLGTALTASAGALAACLAAPAAAAAPCVSPGGGAPMFVTATCEDPVFNAANFVVEQQTQEVAPAPHTKIVGHFKASATTPEYHVTFYLPPRDRWRHRFFQHAYPLEQPENLDDVAFALGQGGYLVNVRGTPCGCGGYRPDAGAAKVARGYAAKLYGDAARAHGYLWGGSGGGLLTIGAAENTNGVWAGIVPYVMPNAGSILNANAIGALGGLALRDRLPAIAAALHPGADRDVFAGLSAEQAAILREELAIGIPLQTFEMGNPGGAILMFLSGGVKENDPAYVEDFWSKPGYEGANPPDYLRAARLDDMGRIASVQRDAAGAVVSIRLDHVPTLGPTGAAGLEYWVYGPNGPTKVGEVSGQLKGDTITLPQALPASAPGRLGANLADANAAGTPGDTAALGSLAPGWRVRVNNLFYLSLHYYHRHAIPTDRDMYTYDQYRRADGTPIPPQRTYLGSTEQALSAAGGGSQTGRIHAKLIVNQSILDGGAQPWMADWYAKRVRRALGAKGYADNFRVFFNDNAVHFDIAPEHGLQASVINYVPSLYQSLTDLEGWVERGVAPAPSSRYTVANGQLTLMPTAAARGGIQPVVTLDVAGGKSATVAAGQPVAFHARVATPAGAGKVTTAAWWFGEGEPVLTPSPVARPAPTVELSASHVYRTPGTYYVTLRATSQRQGDAAATTTAIQNLDRVRVIVR